MDFHGCRVHYTNPTSKKMNGQNCVRLRGGRSVYLGLKDPKICGVLGVCFEDYLICSVFDLLIDFGVYGGLGI